MFKPDYYTIKKAALELRSVNNKIRQQIIETIQTAEKGEMTVTQLYVVLRLEQSVASQHLAILRKSGVVTTKRDGKFIYYSVDEARLKLINEKAAELLK